MTLLATLLLSQAPAPALTYAYCSGNFNRVPTSCTFVPAGPTFYLSGGTTGGGLVTVRITDLTGTVTIAECTGTWNCFAQVGPGHTGTDSVGPPPGGPLLCTVVRGATGNFGCGSGL